MFMGCSTPTPEKTVTHHFPATRTTQNRAEFPVSGYVRIKQIVAPNGPLPIGRSSFWAMVKANKAPQPRKISPRVTVWRAEDINEMLAAIHRGEVWQSPAVEQ